MSSLLHIEVSPGGEHSVSRSISAEFLTAWSAKHAFRHELIADITGVDEILISTPMWNWTIPSVLKAYIDQVILPGTLDGSGADGLKGKKVTFVVSQGGSYAEGAPRHGWDYETGALLY